MKDITHCFTTKSEITNLSTLNNNLLYYSTIKNGIKIFSSPQSKIIKNIQSERFNKEIKAFCISLDAKLIAIADKNSIEIISIENNSIINTIPISSSVNVLGFDFSNTYLLVGTTNGELFQYRYNNTSKLSILHEFAKDKYNNINVLALFDTKLVTATNNGSICFVDIYIHNSKELILNSRTKLTAICFIDEDNIAIGDAMGNLSFICIKKYKTNKKLITPFEKISQIIVIPNSDYMLLNGNKNYITLVNIKIKKISILKYLTFEEKIKYIAISNDGMLFIALANNYILNINISSTQELSSLIVQNSIAEAYKLLEINPLLNGSHEHDILEQKYRRSYKEATLGLIHKNKTAIIRMESIYRNIVSKQEDIRNLYKAFKEYSHLKDLFLEKRYAICYAIVDKYPPLKATPEYKKLEERYKSSILAAQLQMSIGEQDIAKSILQDYITIRSKRPMIKPLLENNHEFLLHQNRTKKKAKLNENIFNFQQAYNNNEFNYCYEILDKNSSLNELEIAKLLNKHYQNIIYKCDEFALKGDIKSVQNELGTLIKISTRKQKTGSLLKVSFHVKITILIDKKSFKEAENMIYSYIDIFGIDSEFSCLMKEFETLSSVKLAISDEQQIIKEKDDWFYSEFFNQ
ncbi:MAG: hypothetical protein U9N02_01475 [Campylobacterota bacterium]|nr:hypothetical protein [Campylobacterota bacterium]